MPKLCFIDTETTGLDPDRQEVWEVACVIRSEDGSETEHVWQLPVRLGDADAIALNIGRYHERRWPEEPSDHESVVRWLEDGLAGTAEVVVPPDLMFLWAREFVDLTRGCHLVGAVVSFDADRLWRLLRRLDECPMWHYHLIDIEALAAGFVMGQDGSTMCDPRPPWKSEELSRWVGVDPEQFDRHTALGDAKWAQALYDAVFD